MSGNGNNKKGELHYLFKIARARARKDREDVAASEAKDTSLLRTPTTLADDDARFVNMLVQMFQSMQSSSMQPHIEGIESLSEKIWQLRQDIQKMDQSLISRAPNDGGEMNARMQAINTGFDAIKQKIDPASTRSTSDVLSDESMIPNLLKDAVEYLAKDLKDLEHEFGLKTKHTGFTR